MSLYGSRLALTGLALLATANAVTASDLAREKRLAAEIEDAIFDGEPLYLDADGHEFLAIQMDAESPRGGVLVLHGRGLHPEWATVAQPLRVGLTDYGWTTLALQMPVLGKEATFYDYVPLFPESYPRIEQGIAHLRQQGLDPIIIVAHSCSVHSTMAWLAERGDDTVDGFVGIGMGATDFGQPMKSPFPFADLAVPVLDLYGGEDYPAVQKMAPRRLENIRKAGNDLSRQVRIPDADHYFEGREDVLVETVGEWLDSVWQQHQTASD